MRRGRRGADGAATRSRTTRTLGFFRPSVGAGSGGTVRTYVRVLRQRQPRTRSDNVHVLRCLPWSFYAPDPLLLRRPAQSSPLRRRRSSYRLSDHVARLTSQFTPRHPTNPMGSTSPSLSPRTISPRGLSFHPSPFTKGAKGATLPLILPFTLSLSLSPPLGSLRRGWYFTRPASPTEEDRAPWARERASVRACAPSLVAGCVGAPGGVVDVCSSVRPSTAFSVPKCFSRPISASPSKHACHDRARARHDAQVAHVNGPVYGTIADEAEEKTGAVVDMIVYESI